MKRTFVTMIALLSGVFAFGQKYTLGQFVDVNGVPAVVISVDDAGEHGLLMSMPRVEKGYLPYYKKAWTGDVSKKEMDAYMESHSSWFNLYPNRSESMKKKAIDAVWEKEKADLYGKLGTSGEENTKIVKEYCAQTGTDFKSGWPEVYWTECLGEGWYMGAEDELTQFAQFFCGGIGGDYKMNKVKWINQPKKLAPDNERLIAGLYQSTMRGLYSLSLYKNQKGKIFWQQLDVMSSKAGPSWFVWDNGIWGGTRDMVAFKKF